MVNKQCMFGDHVCYVTIFPVIYLTIIKSDKIFSKFYTYSDSFLWADYESENRLSTWASFQMLLAIKDKLLARFSKDLIICK